MPSAEPAHPQLRVPPRRVIVLGAGVVGITTAYLLHRAGCEVVLVEAEASAAQGASHANGGQLSYSHAEPWANPQTLRQLPRWLLQTQSPLRVNWQFDPELWWWLAKFLAACTRSQQSALALLGLASYSRNMLKDILNQTQIEFAYQECGTVHLARSLSELEQVKRQAD